MCAKRITGKRRQAVITRHSLIPSAPPLPLLSQFEWHPFSIVDTLLVAPASAGNASSHTCIRHVIKDMGVDTWTGQLRQTVQDEPEVKVQPTRQPPPVTTPAQQTNSPSGEGTDVLGWPVRGALGRRQPGDM